MRDQHDCDMAKKLCKKYSIPIWGRSDAFAYAGDESYLFCCDGDSSTINEYDFYVDSLTESDLEDRGLNTVSIQRFEELAIELNTPEYESVEDIINVMKELTQSLNTK